MHVLTKASCFRPLLTVSKIDKILNFEELRVIALFSRCDNYTILQFLTRASCFKAILREGQIDQNIKLDKSFTFQADFDPPKTWKKQ